MPVTNEPRARHWCFTLNNPTSDELTALCTIPNADYFVWQQEVGESGTHHVQGYVIFSSRYRLVQVKRYVSQRAHFEVARGTPKQNRDYCTKAESRYEDTMPVEHGVCPTAAAGKRTDIDKVKDAIVNGATDRELWAEHTSVMVRYSQGVSNLRAALKPPVVQSKYTLDQYVCTPLSFDKVSVVLWGDSGVGKTQFALCHFESPLMVSHVEDLRKLSEAHDGIVFDDMNFTHLHREAQIHLVDDMERSIHARYGNVTIPAGIRRIFTTNVLYGGIFALEDAAIKRRINVVKFEKCWLS